MTTRGSILLAAATLLWLGTLAEAVAEEAGEGLVGPPEAPLEAPPTAPGPEVEPPASRAAPAAPPPDFVSSRNIGDKLDEARQDRAAIFNFGVRDAVLRLDDRIYRATGLRTAAFYTVLYQRASRGKGPLDATGGDFDWIITWDAVGRRRGKVTGSLAAAFEGRHKIGSLIPPSGLSTTIDSLWTTTSGFGIQDFDIIQLYWRQELFRGRLRYNIGKLSPYAAFFGNRLNSSSLFFVNYAFSDNPATFMPGNGLGLHVAYDFAERWTVVVGIQDANGIKTGIHPSTLRFGEFWYAIQIQYRSEIRGLGAGTWRLGGWYVTSRETADTPPGTGGILSIDQELGTHLIAFLRYAYQGEALLNPEVQFDALTATQTTVRCGVGIPGPFKRLPDDYMGVAFAWGQPADSLAKDSYVGEIFYRLQVESAVQLTLSLQTIRSSTVYDEVYVLSVRLRLEF